MATDPKTVLDQLDELKGLSGSERAHQLRALDASNPDLANDLRQLLDVYDAGPNRPTWAAAAVWLDPDGASLLTGATLAGYTIGEVIGRGGMGVVYEATQQTPSRTVAIKVVRRSQGATDQAERRLAEEAELLGRLSHPNVAQVFAAGAATVAGERIFYIVMELIYGRLMVDAIGEDRPSLRDRLEWFKAVCAGVQHAHSREIVHLDLKPANVMISDEGITKVLDFGIARVVDRPAGAAAYAEGTWLYMSPEQTREGQAPSPDARMDVYSLGVLLLDLIAGAPAAWPGQTSLDLAMSNSSGRDVALRRLEQLEADDDLKAIVGTCLREDPGERYETAAALAADVAAYLEVRPLAVRERTAGYVVSKFARRHPAAVGLSSVLLVTILSAMLVGSVLLVRTTRAETTARQKQDQLQSAFSYVGEILGIPDPVLGEGAADRAVMLDRAAATLDERFRDEPEARAGFALTLGLTNINAGRLPEAVDLLEQAAADLAASYGSDDLNTLTAQHHLAVAMTRQARYAEAEALHRDVLRRRQKHPEIPPRDLGDSCTNLAVAVLNLGDIPEGTDLVEQAIAHYARDPLTDPRDPIMARLTLASLRQMTHELDKALIELREVEQGFAALSGPEHPDTLQARANIGAILTSMGNFDEAVREFEAVVPPMTRSLGAGHHLTVTTQANLARALTLAGDVDAAVAIALECLAVAEREQVVGVAVCQASRVLGLALQQKGELETAYTRLSFAYECFPEGHPVRVTLVPSLLNIAEALEWTEAETRWRDTLETLRPPAADRSS